MNIENSESIAALVMRLSTGVLFLAHGLLKLLVFTPAGTAGYFASLGLPGPLAYVVILIELGAGIALISGIYVRITSLVTIPVLLSAAFFGHGSNGWMFTNEGGGWEFPVFWAVIMGALALMGSGKYTVMSLKQTAD